MKFRYTVIITALVGLALTSCSGYNKLLKHGTLQEKYEAANKYFELKKYNKTITLYTDILPSLMGSSREDTILFNIGMSHYNSSNYEMSQQYFDEYRNKFARMPFAQEAEFLYAMSFFNMSLDPEKDQLDTRKAITSFNEFLNRYPNNIHAPQIKEHLEVLDNKLYYKTFLNSALYYKIGHYNSAITALRTALKEHPEIPYREQMLFLITRSWYEYARGSVPARQLDRYLKMIDSYYNFRSEFPESEKYDKQMEQMLASATKYTEKNGTKSMQLQQDGNDLESLQEKIYELKDQVFDTKNPNERKRLRVEIKESQSKMQAIRKQNRIDQRVIRKDNKREDKLDAAKTK